MIAHRFGRGNPAEVSPVDSRIPGRGFCLRTAAPQEPKAAHWPAIHAPEMVDLIPTFKDFDRPAPFNPSPRCPNLEP